MMLVGSDSGSLSSVDRAVPCSMLINGAKPPLFLALRRRGRSTLKAELF